MSDNFNAGQLSFVDKEGHEWDVTITLAEAMRIDRVDFSAYTEHPVSMLRPSEEFKKELLDNPPLLFALMYYAVKPQADMLGLDEESFCQRIDGSCIEEACVAMLRSVANFIRAMATVLLPLADGLERAIAESRKAGERNGPLLRKKLDEAYNEALLEFEASQAKFQAAMAAE